MLTTKAFADLCSTTKRTIIHYDRIGLLQPKKREGIFRYYDSQQVFTYQKIYFLKSFGMTLREVKKYLKDDSRLLALFRQKTEYFKKLILINEAQLNKAQQFIKSIENNETLITPRVITAKPMRLIGRDYTGRYVEVNGVEAEILKVVRFGKRIPAGITIFKDRAFRPEKAEMFIGYLTMTKMAKVINNIKEVAIPTHKALSYTHIGSYNDLSYMWRQLFEYMRNGGFTESDTLYPYEIYWKGSMTEEDENKYITEIRFPLK